MQGPDSGDQDLNPIFEELFSERLEPIRYDQHPSDDAFLSYLRGKLPKGWRSPDLYLQEAKSTEVVSTWQQNEMTAHIITCIRCRQRVELLRENLSQHQGVVSWLDRALSAMRDQLSPVPRPALVTMAAQFVAIVGLGAWILFQPASLTTAASLQGASIVASSQMPTLPEPGPVFNPDELHSVSTMSPQDRLDTARKLKSLTDPRYIAPLGSWLATEDDAQVQKELVEVVGIQLNSARDQIAALVQMFDQLERKMQMEGDFPSASAEFKQNFNDLFSKVQNFQSFGVSQPEVLCALTGSLSLSQIQKAAKDADAKLIFDGTSPAGSFRLGLPAMNSGQALQQLESQLNLNCENN
jgi:hypothetical protein